MGESARAKRRQGVRAFAVWFLAIQGVGVLLWWIGLIAMPSLRPPFLARGMPEATLMAFLVADVSLFGAGSLVAAYGLARRRSWGWPALLVHAGAGTYAALFCVSLPVVFAGGWLTAASMTPSLIVLPLLAWWLRPGTES